MDASVLPKSVAKHAGEAPKEAFRSILFPRRAPPSPPGEPGFFSDLNLDQFVAAATDGREEYDLATFFNTLLDDIDTIHYRQEVMQDLDGGLLRDRMNAFAQNMCEMRAYLGRVGKLHYREQQQAWFLDAVETYCETIRSLADDLATIELRSRGFRGLRDYLSLYAKSAPFNSLLSEAHKLKTDLAAIQYCMVIKGDRFTVRDYRQEADYSAEVEQTFAKFKQGAVRDYRVRFPVTDDMDHIEAKVLEFVAKLNPAVFAALARYCRNNANFLDATVVVFDREIQFYLSYLDYVAPLKQAGLPFCYPKLSETSKAIRADGAFDLVLARKLAAEGSIVTVNDFHLSGQERGFVVSGPNQGGKTTFARMVGQLHYLAAIGCPVPGRAAQLLLCDQLLTHFEKEERVENLHGKLEDDLVRIRGLLARATSRSIIILNEIFTSTTIRDETFLSKRIIEKLIALDLLFVWVTFVDELASFASQTVSMVSTVVPDNPALRTFLIVRKPADGLAYALAIAQKHGLTYELIKKRIGS